MAVIKYDVSDVEAGAGGEQPPAGVHKVKIAEVNDRRPDKNDLEVVVDFGTEYARVWSYVNFGDSSKWKFREFTDALSLKPKGQFDPGKLVGKEVNVKVIDDSYQGERKARIKTWLKPGSEAEEEPDEEPGEEEPSDDETTSGGGDDDYTEWTVEDLQEEIESRGLEMPKGRKTVDKLADVLLEDDASKEDGAGDGDGDGDAPEDDYDEWTQAELEEEIKDRKLDPPEKGKSKAKYKEALIGVLREDDAEEPF